MQKKRILILLVATIFTLAFISSIVNAQINLNPLTKISYNKGDSIYISGTIISDQQQTLPLKLFLTCDTNQIQVHTKKPSLK